VQLADEDLTPLARCPNVSYLQCARFAPTRKLRELKALRPDMKCLRFDSCDMRVT
jgi:hypothetical protein